MIAIAPKETIGLAPGLTPLQELPRLTSHLRGPRLFIKRDDTFALGGGGNKLRKLDHLLKDALSQGADTVITPGALQSNHARLTAAAAARLGLRCVLVLTDSVGDRDATYRRVGNFLLYQIFGADIRIIPGEQESAPVMEQIAEEERAKGYRPYVVPLGGSNALGSQGYAQAFGEIIGQTYEAVGHDVDAIVLATGSGGTQAGLVAGALDASWTGRVVGISVGAAERPQQEKIAAIVSSMRPHWGGGAEAIEVDDRYVGTGYGQPTESMIEAVRLVARLEGILLDPVYTGKAMAGLIGLISEREIEPSQTVVFLHTGGSPALSAYWGHFQEHEW